MIGLSVIYKILSIGLSYPDEKLYSVLKGLLSESEQHFHGETGKSVSDLKKYISMNSQRISDIRSEYLRVFDIGGLISPYETEYLTEKISRKPFELADIAGFHYAFGFELNDEKENREAIDHIAVELEFMAILAWKEQYAQETGQEKHAGIVRDAQKKFLGAHLARWGFYYCQQVYELECDEWYKRIAKLLEAVLSLECERHGLDRALFSKDICRIPYTGIRGQDITCG